MDQNFEALYPDTARAQDIEKLARYIREGASCQLLSLPGVGRGTVLGLLTNNSKIRHKYFGEDAKSLLFVHVDFSEIRNRPLFDVMKFLFLSLSESLRSKKNPVFNKINELFKESLKFKDELVLFQALKESIDLLVIEEDLRVVFLFDRFEEYIPTVSSQFFTNLRTLRNRAKYKFSVVFSLNRPLEELVDPSILSDFYELLEGNYVYLSLKDEYTTDFRISYIEKITGKKVQAQEFEEILKATGGMGKLVKVSVESLLSEDSVNKKNMREFLFAQKRIQNSLVEICRSLLPTEQTYLINSCVIASEAKQSLSKNLPDGKAGIAASPPAPRNDNVIGYLESVGLLKDGKIQIPLFAEHIKWHKETSQQEAERIVYDTNTNTIKIGEDILSDRLTASEFRLLSFLLNNPDRIVDREELINIVWSSVKSTAGITDQAVDQLIFRLRRKIEKDLNNPSHLLTIKGRGVRFMA